MFHCHRIASAPDLLALHRFDRKRYPYLLESTARGDANCRYTLLMAFPQNTLLQQHNSPDILAEIDIELDRYQSIDPDLPFVGGWFLYLGYEYGALIEPSVDFHAAQPGLPIAFASRIPAAVIVDHHRQQAFIVADAKNQGLIDEILQDLASYTSLETLPLPLTSIVEEDPGVYRSSLAKAQRYIYDGDIFQANLSRAWQVDFAENCDPIAVYQRLRRSNPAPFAALVRHEDHYILSSSPERLVSVHAGRVETRPIAGTHPRGETEEQDTALARQLLQHPKERAEHVMLIDLERNDLGRVCSTGSIQVDDRMTLETYRHVHHIVSAISGELQTGKTVRDLVHAVFPGGTITGCPKVRCMQIISELEHSPRGAYTGALGYISDHGRLDLNILIRTLHMCNSRVEFRAGAGIVSDSVTEKELEETRHKARGLINAFHADL